MSDSTLTPPELARRWKVKPAKVITWIRRGELRAFDASERPNSGRPRYRIPIDAIEEFEQKRAARPQQKTRRRKRRERMELIEFY